MMLFNTFCWLIIAALIQNSAAATLLSCPEVSFPGNEVGLVTDPEIDEASGMVASRTYPDVFWTLNDSNGPSCLYAIAKDGELKHKMCLEGAINYDWEAIATATCDPAG